MIFYQFVGNERTLKCTDILSFVKGLKFFFNDEIFIWTFKLIKAVTLGDPFTNSDIQLNRHFGPVVSYDTESVPYLFA